MRSAGFFPARAGAHAPPPACHPRLPAAARYQRVVSPRELSCLVVPGLQWCALSARGARRGARHGDGSSKRAVRAAGESGDGHDGPQLHPAVPAGSPQGSWGPGVLGRSRHPLPAPAAPVPPVTGVVSRPRGPWTSFSNSSGPSLRGPPRLSQTPAFSTRRSCPLPGTLRSLAASHLAAASHSPLLPLSSLCTLVRNTTLAHFRSPNPISPRLTEAHV